MVLQGGLESLNPKRFDIEGLRAIAVTFVVVYHLFPKLLPGGFIGVDVFFVISGFLIIQHLAREFSTTGRIRVWDFYARRARRLLPASFLVLLVSLGITAALAPGNEISRMATGIGASALYVVNWFFAFFSTGYVHAGDSPSIVQQYWSLSVEEQFYLLWPLLIIGVALVARLLLRRRNLGNHFLLVLLCVVTVASFAYSVWSAKQDPQQAFFFTTTRAWEFAAGGLIALAPPLAATLRHSWQTRVIVLVSWASIAALGGAAFLINDTMPFPGWRAVVPVAATALLIYIGDRGTDWEPTYLSRFTPVVALGGLSYGIYLWHWPLIIGYSWWRGFVPGTKASLAIIIATVALALATQRLIENPLRFGTALKTTKRAFSFALVGSLLVVGGSAGVSSWATQQMHLTAAPPFENVEQIQSAIQTEWGYNIESRPSRFTVRSRAFPLQRASCLLDEIQSCTYGSAGAKKTLVIVGDSYAGSYASGIIDSFVEHDWRVINLFLGACPATEQAITPSAQGWGKEHCASREGTLDILSTLKPTAIVAAHNTPFETIEWFHGDSKKWDEGLSSEVRKLAQIAPTTVLSSSLLPTRRKIGVECAKGSPASECYSPPQPRDWMNGESEAVIGSGAKYVDTMTWFCDVSYTVCPEVIAGTYVYSAQDDAHISNEYSKRLSNLLYEAINAK